MSKPLQIYWLTALYVFVIPAIVNITVTDHNFLSYALIQSAWVMLNALFIGIGFMVSEFMK